MSNTDEELTEGMTFILDSINVRSTGGTVTGWFMYFKIQSVDTEQGSVEQLVTDYITPYKSPAVLDIKRFLFDEGSKDGTVNLEVGPKQIYQGLKNLFRLGYGDIPSPRIDVPLHGVPPSQRESFISAQQMYGS